jgi:hypothetical protein
MVSLLILIMPGLVPGILCATPKRIRGSSPRMMRWGMMRPLSVTPAKAGMKALEKSTLAVAA